MKHYQIEGNTIVLSVKKAPVLARLTLFFIAFALFLLPLIGIIVGLLWGNEFRIGALFAYVIFGLIGFYTLRMALWNAYGKETIKLNDKTVAYEADFGWFKDGDKEVYSKNPILSIKQVGYEEDNKGVLVISGDQEEIATVVKMPITQIEELIERLKDLTKMT